MARGIVLRSLDEGHYSADGLAFGPDIRKLWGLPEVDYTAARAVQDSTPTLAYFFRVLVPWGPRGHHPKAWDDHESIGRIGALNASMSDTADLTPSPSATPEKHSPAAAGSAGNSLVSEKQAAHFLVSNLPSVGREMGDLLGKSILFEDVKAAWLDRAEILQRMQGARLLCHVDVLADHPDQGFMLWPLNDAIFFSGQLLMAAPGAIAENIRKQEMDEDWLDAFGEIVNIFVGGYSNRMKSQYPVQRALRKASVTQVEPDAPGMDEADVSIPEGLYFCLSANLDVEREARGPMLFFFPADALGLGPPDPAASEVECDTDLTDAIAEEFAALNLEALVVVLGDAPESVAQVVRAISVPGIDVLQAGQGYDVTEYLSSSNLDCVFLVVSSISQPMIVRAGKVRTLLSASCALILAGHDWTREYVLKARTEGIDDILVLPADDAAIREKCMKFIGDPDDRESLAGASLAGS
jgi:hypothetical protein